VLKKSRKEGGALVSQEYNPSLGTEGKEKRNSHQKTGYKKRVGRGWLSRMPRGREIQRLSSKNQRFQHKKKALTCVGKISLNEKNYKKGGNAFGPTDFQQMEALKGEDAGGNCGGGISLNVWVVSGVWLSIGGVVLCDRFVLCKGREDYIKLLTGKGKKEAPGRALKKGNQEKALCRGYWKPNELRKFKNNSRARGGRESWLLKEGIRLPKKIREEGGGMCTIFGSLTACGGV